MSSASLDLYAKVEDLLGIDDATEQLHELFVHALKAYTVGSLLDIGCGRGGFMRKMQRRGVRTHGIDRSALMVDEVRRNGLHAECQDVCQVSGTYDAAVAIFDVLNFLDDDALPGFFKCVADVLAPGGVFVADINTLHGFENVADGTMMTEDANRFLCVNAMFEKNVLQTELTLFTQEIIGSYRKEQAQIDQYFHPLSAFRKLPDLQLVHYRNISLYDNNDKMLLIFKKPMQAVS